MLDIKFIRENKDFIKKSSKNKGIDVDVDAILDLDDKRKSIIQEVEPLRAEKNRASKTKPTEDEQKLLRDNREKIQTLEKELEKVTVEYSKLMLQIPNPPKDDVIVGKDDTENKMAKKWGDIPKFSFEPKDHTQIGKELDIIDIERAAKVSGTRFAYLKGAGAQLEFALIQFAMEVLIKKEFTPVIPPVLIKKESMSGMGYLEHGGEEDMYVLDKDNLILVGTSEQSVGAMHTDEILNKKDFPHRYASFSTCFRREAGSYGKDTKGILRVHQFDKIEMFSITADDKSDEEHKFLLGIEEELLQSLEIPYQVVNIVTGDLGAPAARKYDLEAWIPSENKYREVTSTSTTTDFQSRRLNIRYKDGEEIKYVHMLNGTAFAMGRTILAILENNQQEDGSVKIPKILQKYMGVKEIKINK